LNDLYDNAEDYGITDTAYNSVLFFTWYFSWVYKKFRFIEDVFTASKDEYKKFMNGPFMMNQKNRQSVETMYARHGLEINTEWESVRISSSRYPGMMKAIFEVLTAAYQNYKVNCGDYLFTCDFRAIVDYKRTYADIFYMLNDEGKAIAEHIDSFAAGLKIKPSKCNFFNRVDFKKKGKKIFILDVVRQKNIRITMGIAEIGTEVFQMVEKEIEKYEDADKFIEFVRKNMPKCKNCNTGCYYRANPKEFFGKKTIICNNSIPLVMIYAPAKQDLEYICRLISLRAMVMETGISDPFYPVY
jgi:hypothetical protein